MIKSVNGIQQAPMTQQVHRKEKGKEKKTPANKEVQVEAAANDQQVKKVTYDKPKEASHEKTIAALKKESEKAYQQLRQLVEQLLKRQGYSWDKIKEKDFDELQIDSQAIEEAEALIAEDGLLGAEKTSERIVQFAIAISGGDKSKLEELKAAIDKGFKEVENMLGGLPEVSQKTYQLVMEKLEQWYEGDQEIE
ncbi:hypothetical protein SAMN05660297_00996 [Natronincola peptidivorans]|uniref:Uncharacterized protein n=1 Tax=Natronincola peptidivorans TaxID=426128 RepID=A0A1I0AP29_9FIRM|nr:hypothetical protein [Natronincola peptidivorans]SES95522.1 hypothetical protein SAMN05660297_00996 [Natronincola peptidivorans]